MKKPGSKEDGIRTGKQNFSDGSKYVGGWKDDKRNGHGTVISKNSEKFVGEWKNDDKHGFGALFYADGSLLFSGQWHQGSYLNKVKNSTPPKSSKRSKPREKNNWFVLVTVQFRSLLSNICYEGDMEWQRDTQTIFAVMRCGSPRLVD